ncbi:MAG: potassium-transporting ATPase subunit KdpC [Pirellulales bacterium]|nr:potassium-transporting ATPase subunit KdpC [Pirellulales bacterium]
MFAVLRAGMVFLTLFTLITGVIYPLVITGIAQVVFPGGANGSLLTQGGRVVGSSLIGQEFSDARYFWGRPSATGPVPYNAAASTGSNFSPTNPGQLEAVRQRAEKLRAAHPAEQGAIPVDLVTASGSGLDPHISPAAANYQAARVAAARNIPVEKVRELISTHTISRSLGVLGEPGVNVLELNLALDASK